MLINALLVNAIFRETLEILSFSLRTKLKMHANSVSQSISKSWIYLKTNISNFQRRNVNKY